MKVAFFGSNFKFLTEVTGKIRAKTISADIIERCVHEGIEKGYDVVYCHPCSIDKGLDSPDDPKCIEAMAKMMKLNPMTMFIVPGTYPERVKTFEKTYKISNALFLTAGYGEFHRDPVGFIKREYEDFLRKRLHDR